MSELGPEAQKLIQAGRSALRPTSADRERIAAALRARGNLSPAAASLKPSGLAWPALSATVVGIGAVAVIVVELTTV